MAVKHRIEGLSYVEENGSHLVTGGELLVPISGDGEK